jgi:hypothetical protein
LFNASWALLGFSKKRRKVKELDIQASASPFVVNEKWWPFVSTFYPFPHVHQWLLTLALYICHDLHTISYSWYACNAW